MTLQNAYRCEIDACRPGSNDLELPELADLARAAASDPRVAKALEASHASDIALCDGLQEVAIPSGLAERLLASVETASRTARIAAVEIERVGSDGHSLLEAPVPAPQPRAWSRRAWFVVAPALAASLAVVATLVFWQRSEPRSFSEAELAAAVEGWYQQAQQRDGWNPATQPSEQFPVDRSVIPARLLAARSIPVAGNGAGVVYELKRGNRTALLFVVRTPDHYDVPSMPGIDTPLGMLTGPKAATAWQSGGVLYVLVVDRNQGSLRDFVRPPHLT